MDRELRKVGTSGLTDFAPVASAPSAVSALALGAAPGRAPASPRSVAAEARPAGSRQAARRSRWRRRTWRRRPWRRDRGFRRQTARIAAGQRHIDPRRTRRHDFRARRAKAMLPSLAAAAAAVRPAAARRARSHPACAFRDRSCAPQARTTARSRRPCGYRIGRSRREQLNLRTAGRRADHGRCEARANVGLIGRDVVAAGHDGARALRLQRRGVDAKPRRHG